MTFRLTGHRVTVGPPAPCPACGAVSITRIDVVDDDPAAGAVCPTCHPTWTAAP